MYIKFKENYLFSHFSLQLIIYLYICIVLTKYHAMHLRLHVTDYLLNSQSNHHLEKGIFRAKTITYGVCDNTRRLLHNVMGLVVSLTGIW